MSEIIIFICLLFMTDIARTKQKGTENTQLDTWSSNLHSSLVRNSRMRITLHISMFHVFIVCVEYLSQGITDGMSLNREKVDASVILEAFCSKHFLILKYHCRFMFNIDDNIPMRKSKF